MRVRRGARRGTAIRQPRLRGCRETGRRGRRRGRGVDERQQHTMGMETTTSRCPRTTTGSSWTSAAGAHRWATRCGTTFHSATSCSQTSTRASCEPCTNASAQTVTVHAMTMHRVHNIIDHHDARCDARWRTPGTCRALQPIPHPWSSIKELSTRSPGTIAQARDAPRVRAGCATLTTAGSSCRCPSRRPPGSGSWRGRRRRWG